jgi:hypothetical protein
MAGDGEVHLSAGRVMSLIPGSPGSAAIDAVNPVIVACFRG